MTKLLNMEPALQNIRQFGIFDDFVHYDTDDFRWTGIEDDTASSVAIDADGIGGIVTLTAGTLDNDEAYLHTTNEIFKFQNDKPLVAVARLKVTEGGTNQASFMFGLADAVAANHIQDDGTPVASHHGAFFFKQDGEADLKVESLADAANSHTTTTTEVDPDSGDWESYKIEVEPVSDTDKRVTFWHDSEGGQNWKQLKDTNGNLIKHTISLATPSAGTGELSLFVGIKNSSANGTQTMDVDYLGAWQLR